MKSLVRVTVSTEVDVEIEVLHDEGISATRLTLKDVRAAIQKAKLPGHPRIERIGYLGEISR